MRAWRFHLVLAVALTASLAASSARAQGAPAGFELALHGPAQATAGRELPLYGIAYRVLGLAELQALPGARVRARVAASAYLANETWTDARADRRGHFSLTLTAPSLSTSSPTLEVSVGDGRGERTFTFDLPLARPWRLDLVPDRVLYEPDETVRVWARLVDERSGRPLPDERLELPGLGLHVVTDASGVASFDIAIPKEAQEGERQIVAYLDGESTIASYRVGTRTSERLFASIAVTPATAKPGESVTIAVTVSAPSGAPVRGASVEVRLDREQVASAVTDERGVASVVLHAPAYLVHDTGRAPIAAVVQHPAYGSFETHAELHLAVPLSLSVEATPHNGALVPELDGRLYIKVADGSGEPPPAGTPVEVSGAAIPGGVARAQTDARGLAAVPTRLPAGAATRTELGGPYAVTTVGVRVEGPLLRSTSIQVPVRLDVDVVPTAERAVLAPGATLGVTLAVRPRAARRPLVVELLGADGLVAAKVLEPGVTRTQVALPVDRLGLMQVRARALVESGAVESAGACDAVLVRPPRPSFIELQADRELYDVRATAQLRLLAPADGPPSWAAVLVRDLAAHGGERPFARTFLDGAFERAVLDPQATGADLLARAALAAVVLAESPPPEVPELLDPLGRAREPWDGDDRAAARGLLRDPFPAGEELARRGVGAATAYLESTLAIALDEGRLAEVTAGKGPARRLRPDLLAEWYDGPANLGGEPLTLAMLEAADPSFTYHTVARRVGRARLVKLLSALAAYLDPGDEASSAQRAAAREPWGRWLARMVARGILRPEDLADPWGGRFAVRPSAAPLLVVAVEAVGLELSSPGPDGVAGNADDLRDPFARAVPAGTPYAVSSGEDVLMERLAYLAPGEAALSRIRAAFERTSAELREQERGEAVRAQKSEGFEADSLGFGGLGILGSGGGGVGSGYGMGSMGRAAANIELSAPMVSGFVETRAAGMPSLAQIVREHFVPTVILVPSVPLDPSGTTLVPVRLPDSVSTFVAEAIVWSADGWTWSASTTLRVDKTTVVDAPVPRFATAGDALQLPVRVQSRAASDQVVTVSVAAGEGAPVQRAGVRVPAGDGVEVTVPLPIEVAGEGTVLVGASSEAGAPLDAVRRSLTTLPAARRVRRQAEALVAGNGTLELEVPAGATARSGSEITVHVGLGLFEAGGDERLEAWREALLGRSTADLVTDQHLAAYGSAGAREIGIAWTAPGVGNDVIDAAMARLTFYLEQGPGLEEKAQALLGLAPASRRPAARPSEADDLERQLRSLREDLSAGVAAAGDEPALLASVAAALAASAPPGDDGELVRELLRRARRREVRVGEDVWILAPGGRFAATALVAVAEVLLGDRGLAFERVRTLARAERQGGGIDATARDWARVAAGLLEPGGAPRAVYVTIDGERASLALAGGNGRLAAPVLATPGRHRITVDAEGDAVEGDAPVLYARAVTEFGLSWDAPVERPAALAMRCEGEAGRLDERARLTLIVDNRSPRTLGRPVIEIALPAGAELDETGRAALRGLAVVEPDATRGTLRLELAALPPGASRRVPLPFRWSVAGRLRGVGVVAFSADEPDEVAVLPPRVWEIALAGGEKP